MIFQFVKLKNKPTEIKKNKEKACYPHTEKDKLQRMLTQLKNTNKTGLYYRPFALNIKSSVF